MSNGLEAIARIISEGRATSIVALVGAGISTASGIPDFRSPKTGLYANLQQFNLPYPEAIFDLGFFKRRPKAFYTLAQELYPTGRYRPNVTHYFLRMLHEKSLLRRVYTQNIDGLERVAGIPPSKLVEAHGTFASATCLRCRFSVHTRVVKLAIDQGRVARCPKCQGLVKPDIIFFNEQLPVSFWRYPVDLREADLVLVMGTSLEVQPFSRLIFAARKGVPRVLINREAVGIFAFSKKRRDYVILGDISSTVKKLCALLDWTEDLNNVMQTAEKSRVDYIGYTEKEAEKCNSNLQPSVKLKLNLPDDQKREYSTSAWAEMRSNSDFGNSLSPQTKLRTGLILDEDSDSDATTTSRSTLATLLSSSLPTVLTAEHPFEGDNRMNGALESIDSKSDFTTHSHPCQVSARGHSLPIFSDSEFSEPCPFFRSKSAYLSDSNESLLSNALSAIHINTEKD
uniref:NAD-dependent protein deacetylase sirtuin-3 n=1 Tax=Schistocephalus solidus TaxID=70667 RepID=A0A0X3NU36_SCHSO